MFTDKEYNQISEEVYWLDPKHEDYDSTMKTGAVRELAGIEYKILDVKHEPKNGMQAMAVAPVVNGKVDT
ncbi:hypothetical protein UAY_03400, partial [Enterococcus moraviensis ATCC BAA-383]